MNSPDIKLFIRKHAVLFWYIREEEKENISSELLVETILQYGNITDVKQLFALFGIDLVADIFFKQIAKPRNNYHPRTAHFFTLYFKRHVQKYSDKESA